MGVFDDGVSLLKISRRTGCFCTCVRTAIKIERGTQTTDCIEQPRVGWQSSLTEREARRLVWAAVTGVYYAAEFKNRFGVMASVRTA